MAPDLNSVPGSPYNSSDPQIIRTHHASTSPRISAQLPSSTLTSPMHDSTSTMPMRHPRPITPAELHQELEKEQEAIVSQPPPQSKFPLTHSSGQPPYPRTHSSTRSLRLQRLNPQRSRLRSRRPTSCTQTPLLFISQCPFAFPKRFKQCSAPSTKYTSLVPGFGRSST